MSALFEAGAEHVSLAGVRCRQCGRLSFPPQHYGCEECGADGSALAPAKFRAEGTLLHAVHVPEADDGRPAYTLAEVRLTEGVVLHALAADGTGTGTAVAGRIRELFGRPVLRFEPIERD